MSLCASHEFIRDFLPNNNVGLFEVDDVNQPSLFDFCKVTPGYVANIKKIYGERIKHATYDAQFAYDDKGNPLFINQDDELINGIYIGIPNKIYHSLPTLSSSMVKVYKECPALYRRQYVQNIQRKRTLTTQRTLDAGTYTHEIVLEPEQFVNSYYRGIIAAEYPHALSTLDQLKKRAKELKITKGLSSKETLVKSISKKAPEQPLFALIEQEHDQFHERQNKKKIDPIVFDDAIRCAMTILTHDDAGPLLRIEEGLPEVTFIYDCPTTRLKKRTRFDFLRFDNTAVDLKTTRSTESHSFSKDAVNMGYGIQELMYRESYAVMTRKELDSFIFVTAEYTNLDACETFEIPERDHDQLFDVFNETMAELYESLTTDTWNGYSNNQNRKKIQKPHYLSW